MDKNAGEGGQQNDGKAGSSGASSSGSGGKTPGAGTGPDPASLLDAASLFGMLLSVSGKNVRFTSSNF